MEGIQDPVERSRTISLEYMRSLSERERDLILTHYGLVDGYPYDDFELVRVFKTHPDNIKAERETALSKLPQDFVDALERIVNTS